MIAKSLYPLWMLLGVAIAVLFEEPAWCSAAGVLGLGARFVRARAWNGPRGLSAANLLTLARLGLVTCLPALHARLAGVVFAAVVVLVLVLDGLDGAIARAREEATSFGADFDMETDAFAVMSLALLLLGGGTAGAWVLAAGLWRYTYAIAVVLLPALGDTPPSSMYRWIFGVLVLFFAGAFVPWTGAPILAAAGTLLVSFSFVHSIVRSRAFMAPARS